jgi:tetratricopeptide (TPR) repeat protein
MGRTLESIKHFRNAVVMDPTIDESWAGLGVALYETGTKPEAIEAYRKAISMEPNYTSTKWIQETQGWSAKMAGVAAELISQIGGK